MSAICQSEDWKIPQIIHILKNFWFSWKAMIPWKTVFPMQSLVLLKSLHSILGQLCLKLQFGNCICRPLSSNISSQFKKGFVNHLTKYLHSLVISWNECVNPLMKCLTPLAISWNGWCQKLTSVCKTLAAAIFLLAFFISFHWVFFIHWQRLRASNPASLHRWNNLQENATTVFW